MVSRVGVWVYGGIEEGCVVGKLMCIRQATVFDKGQAEQAKLDARSASSGKSVTPVNAPSILGISFASELHTPRIL